MIEKLYFIGMIEQEYADEIHTSQPNVHKKKVRILCKLNKLIKVYRKRL